MSRGSLSHRECKTAQIEKTTDDNSYLHASLEMTVKPEAAQTTGEHIWLIHKMQLPQSTGKEQIYCKTFFQVLGRLNISFLRIFLEKPPLETNSLLTAIFTSTLLYLGLPLTRCNGDGGRQRGVHFHRVRDLQDGDAAIGQADGHHGRAGGVPLQVVDHRCISRVLGQFVIRKCTFLLFCLSEKTNTWDGQSWAQN